MSIGERIGWGIALTALTLIASIMIYPFTPATERESQKFIAEQESVLAKQESVLAGERAMLDAVHRKGIENGFIEYHAFQNEERVNVVRAKDVVGVYWHEWYGAWYLKTRFDDQNQWINDCCVDRMKRLLNEQVQRDEPGRHRW